MNDHDDDTTRDDVTRDDRSRDDGTRDDLTGDERRDLDALERRLAATFTHQANAISVADEPFDPSRRATIVVALEPSDERIASTEVHALTGAAWLRLKAERRARRGRVVWVAMASAAAILVGALFVTHGTPPPGVDTTPANTVAPTTGAPPEMTVPMGGPDAALIPSWAPDGMQVWSLQAGRDDGTRPSAPGTTTQLLRSTTDDAALLIQLQARGASSTVGTTPPEGEGVAVRGTTAHLRRASDENPAPDSLDWFERGLSVTVSMRGLDVPRAVALLDALQPKDDAHLDEGYAPPSVAGWELGGEHLASEPTGGDSVAVLLTYGSSAPTGDQLPPISVTTYGAGDHFPGFLRTQLVGTLAPDGVAVSSGMSTSRPGGAPSYTMVWPDGHTVIVQMRDGIDEGVAERIARSIEVKTLADVVGQRAELSDRLGVGPVLASATVPAGRLELIGTDEPTALCLVVTSGERSCTGRDEVTYWRPTPVLASTIIDGTWHVFAASRNGIDLRGQPGTSAPGPGSTSTTVAPGDVAPSVAKVIPAETASDRGWNFALVAMPNDQAASVSVDLDTHGLNLSRPAL